MDGKENAAAVASVEFVVLDCNRKTRPQIGLTTWRVPLS
jgi:hypothetical protein